MTREQRLEAALRHAETTIAQLLEWPDSGVDCSASGPRGMKLHVRNRHRIVAGKWTSIHMGNHRLGEHGGLLPENVEEAEREARRIVGLDPPS